MHKVQSFRIFTSPQPTPQAPKIVCRCCGQPMDAQFQQSPVETRPGYWLLTCWQKPCRMYGYTLADKNYATLDLTPYLSS